MSEPARPLFDDPEGQEEFLAAMEADLEGLLRHYKTLDLLDAELAGGLARQQEIVESYKAKRRSLAWRREQIVARLAAEPLASVVREYIDGHKLPRQKSAKHEGTGLTLAIRSIPLRIKLFDPDKAAAWGAASDPKLYLRIKTEPVCAAFEAWFTDTGDVPPGFEATGGVERIEVK